MHLFRKERPKPMIAATVSVAKRERESIERNVREVDARRDLRATTDASDFVTAMLTASNVSYEVIKHDKEYTSLKVCIALECFIPESRGIYPGALNPVDAAQLPVPSALKRAPSMKKI
jgi:hypothetical protein